MKFNKLEKIVLSICITFVLVLSILALAKFVIEYDMKGIKLFGMSLLTTGLISFAIFVIVDIIREE